MWAIHLTSTEVTRPLGTGLWHQWDNGVSFWPWSGVETPTLPSFPSHHLIHSFCLSLQGKCFYSFRDECRNLSLPKPSLRHSHWRAELPYSAAIARVSDPVCHGWQNTVTRHKEPYSPDWSVLRAPYVSLRINIVKPWGLRAAESHGHSKHCLMTLS